MINSFDITFVDSLPTLPPMHELDAISSFAEVRNACQGLWSRQSARGVNEIWWWMSHTPFSLLYHHAWPCISSGKTPTLSQSTKGDKSVCGKYPDTSLLVVAGKILAHILFARLLDVVTEVILPELQSGFRKITVALTSFLSLISSKRSATNKTNISI